MGEDSEECAPARYRAFISYSHADARFAAWLHRKLEHWPLPGQPRLTPIFIDRAELAAGPDLSSQVREALAGSAALIVLASPAARSSQWVAQEVSLFRELHPDRPVLAALLKGEPGDAFPQALLVHAGQVFEPLAADFRDGHDGKRLALLKILAGLTAQPLDRLVQRDVQTRQRRVMAITAGAVLLSLVLAAALIVALRARTEAEHQRAEAEGMVEFMLTDLRDKLKGVGRLDVMDAVNQRAMAHYSREDLSQLPAAVLERRARLLFAMAEDDLATDGKRDRAKAEIFEAWRATGSMLARQPDDLERIFNHAQSEYWMGYAAYLERDSKGGPALQQADLHWHNYLKLAQKLVAADGNSTRWRRELAYAEGNICTLLLEVPQRAAAALGDCSAARQAMQEIARNAPGDLNAQLDFANRLAWEADAMAAQNRHDHAVRVRQQQLDTVVALTHRFGSDARNMEAVLLAEYGLAKALHADGKSSQAMVAAAAARKSALTLRGMDPSNRSWGEWMSKLDHDFPLH